MEYKMDTDFIGKPHEWDPRRLYSQTGADWQYRVDFERLRRDRLQKAKEQMNIHDLGALVLFAGRQHPLCDQFLPGQLEI